MTMMMKLKAMKLFRKEVCTLRKQVSGRVVKWVRCCFCDYYYEEENIPKDVPRGHVVVYVGEDFKRYVIRVSVLNHPQFKALLDDAEDVFGFSNASKLHIPCNERIFLSILYNAALVQHY
ncbi:protein SMALL AUXIN UP-REGULATED RNA 12-like [Prosopis cineraria]|uniref:protein SMALL AUXIN UP-REGULATED RNA 12-like n=1 Tax=Prosopis cineraria TaxID=364024 RepID=UPI00240EF281|nr:protein SMALL AUXIN UP-REGULATED RNA 12-like [Prosopis cineraria]